MTPLELTDRTLRARRDHERRFIDEVETTLAERVAVIPWQIKPPVGGAGLRRLVETDSSLERKVVG